MQPSWLPSIRWAWIYILLSRLIVGLLGGLVGGAIIGMGLHEIESWRNALQRGVVEGLIGGLIAGPVVAVVDMAWMTRVGQLRLLIGVPQYWQSLIKIIVVTLIVCGSVSLLFGAVFGTMEWLGWSAKQWLTEGMEVGIVFGMSAALVFAFEPQGARHSLANDIQTVEHLNWTLREAGHGALIGALAGSIAGVVVGMTAQETAFVHPLIERGMSQTTVVVTMTLICGLFASLIGAVFSGLSGTLLPIGKVTPNQGIRLSMINAGLIAPAIGIVFGLLSALAGGLVGGSTADALTYGLYGLFIGVLAALWYGGLFLIQHTTLRILLWKNGCLPRYGALVGFLDYAAQRIFLQKVGGAYRFIHRYLQEHFMRLVDREVNHTER
jgi:hypothetical protein